MWLDELIKQHEELESPLSFWYWAALAATSAVVRDNVWMDRGGAYKLYPNIYVMLHADSGLKKGPPVAMAKKLVSNAIGTDKMMTGRFSIQGLLKKMGTFQTQPGGVIDAKSTMFICASELSSAIVEDKAATDILTDLYDRNYNDEWNSVLKMENFSLKDPLITMLTATNEAHSSEFFGRKDLQGGFFARTFIVYENKRNRVNSLMFPLSNPIDYKQSALYLKELLKLRGPFVMSPESAIFYDEWYKAFVASVDAMEKKDSTGTLNRFGDSVLKVAMLIALARFGTLEINIDIIQEAINQCEKLVGNIRKVTIGRGKNIWAHEKGLFLTELINREPHMISREQLNKKYYQQANASDWDEIAKSLEAGGFIRIETHGSQVVYKMTDRQVEVMKAYLSGKTNRES